MLRGKGWQMPQILCKKTLQAILFAILICNISYSLAFQRNSRFAGEDTERHLLTRSSRFDQNPWKARGTENSLKRTYINTRRLDQGPAETRREVRTSFDRRLDARQLDNRRTLLNVRDARRLETRRLNEKNENRIKIQSEFRTNENNREISRERRIALDRRLESRLSRTQIFTAENRRTSENRILNNRQFDNRQSRDNRESRQRDLTARNQDDTRRSVVRELERRVSLDRRDARSNEHRIRESRKAEIRVSNDQRLETRRLTENREQRARVIAERRQNENNRARLSNERLESRRINSIQRNEVAKIPSEDRPLSDRRLEVRRTSDTLVNRERRSNGRTLERRQTELKERRNRSLNERLESRRRTSESSFDEIRTSNERRLKSRQSLEHRIETRVWEQTSRKVADHNGRSESRERRVLDERHLNARSAKVFSESRNSNDRRLERRQTTENHERRVRSVMERRLGDSNRQEVRERKVMTVSERNQVNRQSNEIRKEDYRKSENKSSQNRLSQERRLIENREERIKILATRRINDGRQAESREISSSRMLRVNARRDNRIATDLKQISRQMGPNRIRQEVRKNELGVSSERSLSKYLERQVGERRYGSSKVRELRSEGRAANTRRDDTRRLSEGRNANYYPIDIRSGRMSKESINNRNIRERQNRVNFQDKVRQDNERETRFSRHRENRELRRNDIHLNIKQNSFNGQRQDERRLFSRLSHLFGSSSLLRHGLKSEMLPYLLQENIETQSLIIEKEQKPMGIIESLLLVCAFTMFLASIFPQSSSKVDGSSSFIQRFVLVS